MLPRRTVAPFSIFGQYLHRADNYPVEELLSTMNREQIDSVLRSLRRVNLQGSLFGQTVAIQFGLSESDIEALEVLMDTKGSATAGTLSEVMGLTTGAVTRVIDRLEQAGYVRRVPDPADRRRVIVEVVPDKVAGVQATLGRVGEASTDEIGRYSEAELAVINDFLTRMAAITREEATALRQTPDQGAAATEHSAPIGGLSRARLLFRSGAHELLLRGSPDIGELYQAKFEGPVPQVRLRDGVVTVQYKSGFKWDWKPRRADVSMNATIPWDVEIVGGTSKLQGKLAGLDLRSFELTGGVDQLRLTLGRPTGHVPIRLTGGASSIRIERPAGVPVRLKLQGGAASIEFDKQKHGPLVDFDAGVIAATIGVGSAGLGGTGGGGRITLESSGAATAGDRYELEFTGGASKIAVTELDA
jgi:DNA-binding MarR family transcriptional regulator